MAIFANTELFSLEAKHFQKYGRYCDDPKGSPAYYEYWDEQYRRCKYGYSVAGVKITGDHYAYLNFAQIKLVEEDDSPTKRKKKNVKKVISFPSFWDSDYHYFWEMELAKNSYDGVCGIPTFEHPLAGITDEDKLFELAPGGEHMIVAKKRRWGASYKNGFMAAKRFASVEDSVTLIGAYFERYTKATMGMATDYLNFFNEHVPFLRQYRMTDQDLYKAVGYEEEETGIWIKKGINSQLYGITYKDNPDAARGLDGTEILFEEAGKFPNLMGAYMTTKLTVMQGDYTTGFISIFGTGGGKDANWKEFEDMFYNPKVYGLRAYENIWDEAALGTYCGYFVPEYVSKQGYIDKDGNSDIPAAKQKDIDHVNVLKATAKDPTVVNKYLAERPHSPRHAFMRAGMNNFPVPELEAQLAKVRIRPEYRIGVSGMMVKGRDGLVRFEADYDRKPINNFPHSAGEDLSGAVVIYFEPERKTRKDSFGNIVTYVPDDMYYAVQDPYDSQGAVSKSSLGVVQIYKRMVKGAQVGNDDMLVAEWVARPEDPEDFDVIGFYLTDYYNCKLGFENNRGAVIQHAKLHDYTHLLEAQFTLSYEDSLEKSKVNAPFGMHINDRRKAVGIGYLNKWLRTKRYYSTEEGRWITNVDFIYSEAFLLELIKFNPEGNFDRVSCAIIGRFYDYELQYIEQESMESENAEDDFFSRDNYFGDAPTVYGDGIAEDPYDSYFN